MRASNQSTQSAGTGDWLERLTWKRNPAVHTNWPSTGERPRSRPEVLLFPEFGMCSCQDKFVCDE